MVDSKAGNNTIYFQTQVLKADAEAALEVFADVVCHPSFPKEELETYRPMLLDQIRRINEQWRSELASFFKNRFFRKSPYRLEALGSEKVVAAATREDVERLYRQRITAGQTVLAVFGDLDPAKIEPLVRKYFADLPAGGKPEIDAPTEKTDAPRLYIKAKGADRRAAGIYIGFDGMKIVDVDDVVPMAVLDTIISGYRLPTGWLFESLRGNDRSYVYEVHAVNFPGLVPGYFGAYAACQPEKVNEVYKIMTEQFDKARAGKFSEEELVRAKTIITTTDVMEQQTNSERAMAVSLDELYGLGYSYREQFDKRVRSVTLDDVRRVAKKYLTSPVVAVVTPSPELVDIGIKPTEVVRDDGGKKAAGAADER